MIRYFDTSVLAKRVLEESGSTKARASFRGVGATSVVSWAELVCAVERAARMGRLLPAERAEALEQALRDYEALSHVELGDALQPRIRELAAAHPLGANGAIHLASALPLQALHLQPEFWCADRTLAQAARAEGLTVVVPT